jgi:hypothetical protein
MPYKLLYYKPIWSESKNRVYALDLNSLILFLKYNVFLDIIQGLVFLFKTTFKRLESLSVFNKTPCSKLQTGRWVMPKNTITVLRYHPDKVLDPIRYLNLKL